MEISSIEFFSTLSVNRAYYNSKFKKLGLSSIFFYNEHDLQKIVDDFPVTRYRSSAVVQRAAFLLEKYFAK